MGEINTSKHIVAYIDLLGFKKKMQSDSETQTRLMNELYLLYNQVVSIAEDISENHEKQIKVKIFSDNIIIAKELANSKELVDDRVYHDFFVLISFFQLSAAQQFGWLLRGGITIGELFIDDIMVWGEALINAYNLENNVAVYPRVLIEDKIAREVLQNKSYTFLFIEKDFDGMYYLNYVGLDSYVDAEALTKQYEDMKNERYNDLKVYQKLNWHKNYITNVYEKYKSY